MNYVTKSLENSKGGKNESMQAEEEEEKVHDSYSTDIVTFALLPSNSLRESMKR